MPPRSEAPQAPEAQRGLRRGRRILLACVLGVTAMVGMAYASVPLYRKFCQATGFNGTARRAERGPTGAALHRPLTVRFDTNVRGLPWAFTPEEPTQTINVGGSGLAYFRVTNNSDAPLTGRAGYNVAPESAGSYFIKTQCFCFNDQTIAAHKTMQFPVVYYVEPKFASDPDTRALREIVLSYTFYPVRVASGAGVKRAAG